MKLMSKPIQAGRCEPSAFTLIELLVVISIITVLAALAFPAIKGIKQGATRKKVMVEMQRVETAIDSYKDKYNFYPPDNPGNPLINQLYFELLGTTNSAANQYRTLDGSATINAADFRAVFGPNVTGFVNQTRDTSGEGRVAVNFFSKAGLPPSQVGAYMVGGSNIRLIVCSVPWPSNRPDLIPGHPGLNPWRYNSSSPTNNPNSYDLWVDVIIGGKTNRISNWSASPQILK
jgi:prepilin-type N-terminal cleavage/methylation domain-containing protein